MKIQVGPSLAEFKEQMKAKVDAEAEAFRHRFITPGSGQAMVYLRKEQEALDWLDDNNAAAPHIAAEAQATGRTMQQMAELVVQTAAQWREISPAIEALRQQHKTMIDAATSIPEAQAAADVDWDQVVS